MRKILVEMQCITFAFALSITASAAQSPAPPAAAPVPPAIRHANIIFVSNAGADSGLFPHPFSGAPDRAYNQFYAELRSTGQYRLVEDPRQADLVLELRLTAPYGPQNADKAKGASDPLPMFRLVVYDANTHWVLWAFTESVDIAYLQKSHDRNFDDALTALLRDFQSVAGKSLTTAP